MAGSDHCVKVAVQQPVQSQCWAMRHACMRPLMQHVQKSMLSEKVRQQNGVWHDTAYGGHCCRVQRHSEASQEGAAGAV